MALPKKIFILWAFLSIYLAGCSTVGTKNMNQSKWLMPESGKKAQALVVILHGLNLKPERMDGWAEEIQNLGAVVARFSLSGHQGHPEGMTKIEVTTWKEQFSKHMQEAQEKAQEMGVPIYFLGFSLGALVGLEYLAQKDESAQGFDKMVLIAPAIATPWYAKLSVGVASIFGKKFMLPSRSPKKYRANKGTPVIAYQALFKLKKSLEIKNYKNTNINTLVLLDHHDELIPLGKIKKIIHERRLSNWKLHILNNRFAYDNYGFRHLLVDKEAVGEKLWEDIISQVTNHFGF